MNKVALIHSILILVLTQGLEVKAQLRDPGSHSVHPVKTYTSNDSVTLSHYRSRNLYIPTEISLADTQGQLRFIKRILSTSSNIPKGKTQSYTLAGSLILNISSTGTTCGQSNGTFNVVASGGTPPYSYSENGYPPQSSGFFFAKAAGTYLVAVQDASGLTDTAKIILTNTYNQPTVYLVGYTQESSCNSSDGTIILQGSGGTPPYKYAADFFNWQTNDTLKNLPAFYAFLSLEVMDSNGCFNDLYPLFDYDNPSSCKLGFQIGGYNQACKNEGSLVVTGVTGGTGPYQYSLDSINYQTSPNFSNLPSGLYKVYVKDATGYVQMKAAPVAQFCPISATVTGDGPPCGSSTGSILVSATYGNAPYQYSIDGINFQTSNVFNNLKPGRYTITVVDYTGAYATVDAVIDNSCLVLSDSTSDDMCANKNGIITVIANNGVQPYQYSIDGVHFQAGNVFSNLAAGSYTITVKDAAGQVADTLVTVHASCLNIQWTPNPSTCGNRNGSISITLTNGTAPYQYSLDGINFQTSNVFMGLAAGNYTLTVKDANGNLGTQTATLINMSGPTLGAALSQANCANSSGSISLIRTGGTGPFQYSIEGVYPLQSDSIFINLDSGKYIGYVQDVNGCIATDTVYLTALPTPVISLGNDSTLCPGDSLQLKAPIQVGYSYQWQDGSSSQNYTVRAAGTYTLTVTNQYQCAASSSVTIQYIHLPVFQLGKDSTLCQGSSLLLQPLLQPGASYLWSDGSSGSSYKVHSPGTYWLRETDSGCTRTDTITVTYQPMPVVSLGNDTTLCDGQTILLLATNPSSTYLWQDGSTQSSYTVSKAGTYTVLVNENGCDTSANITVSYISKPLLAFITDTTLCMGQKMILDASYPNSSYLWQDGSTSPQFQVSQEGKYWVQVTNVCGTTTDSSLVNYENCTCRFYVPNAFTPNDDGVNDIFLPKYQCLYSNFVFKIYNRWGQQVFMSENPNSGWDGKLNGTPQPPGAYVWDMTYKDNLTGKTMRKYGTVVLIR